MNTQYCPVVHAGPRLSLAELHSARLDGELVAVGAAFQLIDQPDSPLARAAALHPVLLDARAIVSDRTAAWVWGWVPSFTSVTTCVSIAARLPTTARRALATREVVIGLDEVARVGDVRVTTPLRTAIDLARLESDDGVVEVITTALTTRILTASELASALDRAAGISHITRARRRIELAISRC